MGKIAKMFHVKHFGEKRDVSCETSLSLFYKGFLLGSPAFLGYLEGVSFSLLITIRV